MSVGGKENSGRDDQVVEWSDTSTTMIRPRLSYDMHQSLIMKLSSYRGRRGSERLFTLMGGSLSERRLRDSL